MPIKNEKKVKKPHKRSETLMFDENLKKAFKSNDQSFFRLNALNGVKVVCQPEETDKISERP